ncbi:MAG: DUF4238 domain-containing protein, partial [Candidatus Kariarchaeaceae archaeon]
MSNPKRHHYLSQFYLEGFCREEYFWVYDREEHTFRKQTPVNTAVQKHYYSIEGKDGKRNSKIEELFSQLEGKSKCVIDSIVDGKTISNEDKIVLSLFIAFTWTRIPDFERMVNESMKQGIKKIGDILHEDESRIKQTMEKCEKDTGQKIEIDPAQLKEFWDRGEYDIVMKRNASLGMMLKLSPEFARYLSLMDWTIAKAPQKYSFITTDSPLVLVPNSDEKAKAAFGSSVGLLIPGVQKYFPLHQKFCLIIGDLGDKIQYEKYNKSSCQSINYVLAR